MRGILSIQHADCRHVIGVAKGCMQPLAYIEALANNWGAYST